MVYSFLFVITNFSSLIIFVASHTSSSGSLLSFVSRSEYSEISGAAFVAPLRSLREMGNCKLENFFASLRALCVLCVK
jgi:hypothetical protein